MQWWAPSPSIETGSSNALYSNLVRPSAEDVWAQLERMLSHPLFQASEKRRAFLRFIVSEALAGRADGLKGYTIALAVFGRDQSFDPQADPVVRLEARRLRRDLDSYFVDAGQNDPLRISIPKGSYVPSFEWHNVHSPAAPIEMPDAQDHTTGPAAADASARSKQTFPPKRVIAAVLVACLAVGIAGWMLLAGSTQHNSNPSREPAVLVTPFEALSPGENTRYFASGISHELISNLFRFASFRLYALPVRSSQDSRLTFAQIGHNLGAAYIISGSVQANAEEIRITAQVLNATSAKVVWTKSYTRPYELQSLMDIQRELASEIATAIGQPYGVVKTDIGNNPLPAVSSIESYLCVQRAYGYRRNFLRAEFDPVLHCLQQTVQRDPGYSDGWAMLGWLHVDAGRLGYTGDDNRQKEYEKAVEATTRAVTLDPSNPLALKALGSAYHYIGRYADSERITREAVTLNPNDPEALAQLGWRLAVRGHFDEGIPMLKRAIERSLSPPSWYFHLIAIDLYLKGDYQQMLRVAERSAQGDPGFSQFLLALANSELGNRSATQQALEKMSQYQPVGGDPGGFLRRHGATDQLQHALLAGLEKARAFASTK